MKKCAHFCSYHSSSSTLWALPPICPLVHGFLLQWPPSQSSDSSAHLRAFALRVSSTRDALSPPLPARLIPSLSFALEDTSSDSLSLVTPCHSDPLSGGQFSFMVFITTWCHPMYLSENITSSWSLHRMSSLHRQEFLCLLVTATSPQQVPGTDLGVPGTKWKRRAPSWKVTKNVKTSRNETKQNHGALLSGSICEASLGFQPAVGIH